MLPAALDVPTWKLIRRPVIVSRMNETMARNDATCLARETVQVLFWDHMAGYGRRLGN